MTKICSTSWKMFWMTCSSTFASAKTGLTNKSRRKSQNVSDWRTLVLKYEYLIILSISKLYCLAVATKEDHRKSDCILFVFMTHGYNGKLYAKDTHYNPDPLRLLFTSDKCPSLAGKPKIFIIQACRGNSPDLGTSLTPRPKHSSSHRVSSSDETDGHKSEPFKMATHADFLIANSTVSRTTNTSW